ncbi:MAG: radical SAM protein [Chloroflexi bacterium]|nr:radical SAM protein [Chloroflexota bacterium]
MNKAKRPAELAVRLGAYILKNRLKGRKRFPLVTMLEPLEMCNLACIGCGRIREYKPVLDKMMPVEEALAAVHEAGSPIVSIAGGEPTIHPRIHEIINQLVAERYFVYCCTNGLLLERMLKKIPPSNKNQQFKDAVLWENCLEVLKTDAVCLVSNDKAFYKSREYSQGLADELKQDIEKCPNEFKIFPRLADLLSEIKTGVQIEPEILIEAYMNQNSAQLEGMASKQSFIMEGEPRTTLEVFATENPLFLYFDFTIEFPCVDTSNEGRTDARIYASGEGKYNAEEKKIVELTTRGETLLHRLPDGTEKKLENIVIGVMTGVIGHRTVEHSVKRKL